MKALAFSVVHFLSFLNDDHDDDDDDYSHYVNINTWN